MATLTAVVLSCTPLNFLQLEMIAHDKQEKERSDARNAVEEYIYDMRGKVDGGEYEKYSDDKTRQRLLHDLRSTEDWLYDQGTNQDTTMYLERLKTLKVTCTALSSGHLIIRTFRLEPRRSHTPSLQ